MYGLLRANGRARPITPCAGCLVTRFTWGAPGAIGVLPKAACQKVAEGGYDLVQSHERLSCCDIFRAGDGVHAAWLEARQKYLDESLAWLKVNPFHANSLGAERRMFASHSASEGDLHFAHGAGRCAAFLRGAGRQVSHNLYNGVDLEVFLTKSIEYRDQLRQKLEIPAEALVYVFVGSGFKRKGLEVAIRALPPRCASRCRG